MKEIKQTNFSEERALFGSADLRITDCVFDNGESPLKECANIELEGCLFRWKYPIWYGKNIQISDCTLFDMARAGIWYTDNISIKNTIIEAPKNVRRCNGIRMENVSFPNASETLWSCNGVTMDNVSAKGDYFAMNCENMEVNGLRLIGNYSFDGVKNVTIRNSKLLTKDAFWNSDNVTVYDSFISGEYLGWNAKNLTLINCTVESLQGMCYIDNLVMKNCKLVNTTLAFEYSTVDAEVTGRVISVLNPSSGTIKAERIDTLYIQPDKIDPSKTKIICADIGEEKQDDIQF